MAQGQDKILERKVFQMGEVIFKEGEEGNRAFVVQRGEVEISKTIDGKRTVLGIVGPGGIFGEMALIDDAPRMATAVTLDVTTVILVSRQMLELKLSKADPFLRGLINIFAANLRSLGQKKAEFGPE
jgi:CRP/FNR family transcriptional regulator, cyclic AMP receptor protein